MIKKFLLFTVFLLALNYGFSVATFGYDNSNGYVNLSNGSPANNINISLNCLTEYNNTIYYNTTNINGYYSFSGIRDEYDGASTYLICYINSTELGVFNTTLNYFTNTTPITNGNTIINLGNEINFTYNTLKSEYFDFSNLTGKVISLDKEGVKNQTVTLKCPNQETIAITNELGYYDFSGTSFTHSCESDSCNLICNASIIGNISSFTINPYDNSTAIKEINLTYNNNVKVNGNFDPVNGTYGNRTYFSYNISTFKNDNPLAKINFCGYYFNESKSFNQTEMISFNNTSIDNSTYYANLSIQESGQHDYYVLCNTSLTTETIPKIVSYNFSINGVDIKINSPKNDSVFSKNSIFNITLDLPAINCKYSINQNQLILMTNSSMTQFFSNQTGLNNGNNTITFYCTDYFNIITNKSINFIADINAPQEVGDSFTAAGTTTGNVLLTWNSVSDAVYYYIYRAKSGAGPISFSFYANVSSTNYKDLNVKLGDNYYYMITAIDAYGNEGSGSYSQGVYVKSLKEVEDENKKLYYESIVLKNQTLKAENELKEKNEIFAQMALLQKDLNYFQEFSNVLSTSDIEIINNIKYLMNNYESKNLNELKSAKYQINYNLNTYLKNYKKSS
ncbi:MAG: hypothetical protein PHN56_04055, partial [Candidatus Nanoarchaeia archaeon]|nr:hypothetical protein [Candidatus Nanoarchaeia archaeon]